ncbi:MAG TPA: cupin domain-containing protein [Dehalococcoidia bacterium]|nr:cupin domain-containing protein [Dehalococcoidia bacterium]
MPAPAIRRVVTGHNDKGLAIVALDEQVKGEIVTQIWGTEKVPSDNVSDWAYGVAQPGPTIPGGSALRFVDINPGFRSAMHRTSTIDYVFILEGELDMELDGGEWVHLNAGDIVVQRGTNHAWENKSDKVCRLASVLINAEPYTLDGKPLPETL